MTQPKRLLMKIDLSKYSNPSDENFRCVKSNDISELGVVMFEAYQGTIDYGGESIEEAQAEVTETLKGKYGPLLEKACLVAEADHKIVSAVIFNWFEKEKMPLLTFSMTRADYKGKGLAKRLIIAGLEKLREQGFNQCCLVVTEGNEPAFSIYRSLGFVQT